MLNSSTFPVADVIIHCDQYGLLIWPMWFLADVVWGWYGLWPIWYRPLCIPLWTKLNRWQHWWSLLLLRSRKKVCDVWATDRRRAP